MVDYGEQFYGNIDDDPDSAVDALAMGARTSIANRAWAPGRGLAVWSPSLVNETLAAKAIQKSISKNGTFKTEADAKGFLLYDDPSVVEHIILGARDPSTVNERVWGKKLLHIRDYIEDLPAGMIHSNNPDASQCGQASNRNPEDLKFRPGITKCWLCGCIISNLGLNQAAAVAMTVPLPTVIMFLNMSKKMAATVLPGTPAETAAREKLAKKIVSWNKPQCEHIIPCLRAAMMIGMFAKPVVINQIRASIPGTKEEQEAYWQNWLNQTTDNYLWSHAVCNAGAGKSATLLIDLNNVGTFGVAEEKARKLADKIQKIVKEGRIQPFDANVGCTMAVHAQLPDNSPSCYIRQTAPDQWQKTKYGNCPNPNPSECSDIGSVKEVIDWEANRASAQVNVVWSAFGGNIRAFAEYCLLQTQLYVSAEDIAYFKNRKAELENTPAGGGQRGGTGTKEDQEMVAEDIIQQSKTLYELMQQQVEIVTKMHTKLLETLINPYFDKGGDERAMMGGLQYYVFGDRTNPFLAKTRYRQQIQKIFTQYCRNSSIVFKDNTRFCDGTMVKMFQDANMTGIFAAANAPPAPGPPPPPRPPPSVAEMRYNNVFVEVMNTLARISPEASARVLAEYISCLVIYNIRVEYGWHELLNMPHPTNPSFETWGSSGGFRSEADTTAFLIQLFVTLVAAAIDVGDALGDQQGKGIFMNGLAQLGNTFTRTESATQLVSAIDPYVNEVMKQLVAGNPILRIFIIQCPLLPSDYASWPDQTKLVMGAHLLGKWQVQTTLQLLKPDASQQAAWETAYPKMIAVVEALKKAYSYLLGNADERARVEALAIQAYGGGGGTKICRKTRKSRKKRYKCSNRKVNSKKRGKKKTRGKKQIRRVKRRKIKHSRKTR